MTNLHGDALGLLYRLRMASDRAQSAGLLDQAVSELSAALGRIERMIPAAGRPSNGSAEIIPMRRSAAPRRLPAWDGPPHSAA